MGSSCSGSSPCSGNIIYTELVNIDEKLARSTSSLYHDCQVQLKQSEKIYQEIVEYKGCQELARAAMTDPCEEKNRAAFEGLLLAVEHINNFYEYSKTMGQCFKKLLKELSERVPSGKRFAQLNNTPGLTYQLTQIMDFAIKFDHQRMKKENVTNDFSFYGRLSRHFPEHKSVQHSPEKHPELQKFIQHHIPMTMSLIDNAAEVSKNTPESVYVLSTIANAYLETLQNKDKMRRYINHKVLVRAMTLAVIIFDCVDKRGAFEKRSPIKIKQIILVLKKDWGLPIDLLRTVQFTSKNFKNAPDNIQSWFE